MRRLLLAVLLACLCAPLPAHAFRARARDFRCLTDGVKAAGKHFYIFNPNHHRLRRAVKMTQSGDVSKGYPVGTILQLFPFEAMVKHPRGYNPAGNDWEFLRLGVTSDNRTMILTRGKDEVANALGSCQGCHARVAPARDLVCEFVIGASGLGLTDAQIAAAQAKDPRCTPK